MFTRVECWDCALPLNRVFPIAPETGTRSRLTWTISPRDNFLIYWSWRPADQYQEIVFVIRVTLLYNYIYIYIYFYFKNNISSRKPLWAACVYCFTGGLRHNFLEHVICYRSYSEEFYKSEFFAMFTTFIMAAMPEVKERHLPISIPVKESSCLSLTLWSI